MLTLARIAALVVACQLRLVIDAVEPQAAREVDQRLLLVERLQHTDRRLDGGQLPVGIEDVELAIVLPERGARVGGTGVRRVFVEALAFARDNRADYRKQLLAVVGKIRASLSPRRRCIP